MSYVEMIIEDTGCKPEDASKIENVMREHVFHSTLDRKSRKQFRDGARQALHMLKENRELFDAHFQHAKQIFEGMKANGARV